MVISVAAWSGTVFAEPGVYSLLAGREPDAMLTPTLLLFLPPHDQGEQIGRAGGP